MSDSEKFVGVTRDVVDGFIKKLEEAGVDAGVTKRLRSTVLDKAKVSEKDLREALFPVEET
ncbi:MAG: hypothetical protein JJ911_10650 [Rhizobiaceae bacterium]|nr:hypothetical protein [Rhizobiaceae bacterium]